MPELCCSFHATHFAYPLEEFRNMMIADTTAYLHFVETVCQHPHQHQNHFSELATVIHAARRLLLKEFDTTELMFVIYKHFGTNSRLS